MRATSASGFDAQVLEVAVDEETRVTFSTALRQPFEVQQQDAAANCELGEENVEYADPTDDHALHIGPKSFTGVETGSDPRAFDAAAARRGRAAKCHHFGTVFR